MGGEQKVEEEVNVPFDIIEEVTKDILVSGSILNVEMIDENYHEANIEAISLVNETGNYVIHTEDALNSQIFIDWLDRKSTRLNSSHVAISYAVFCLKKKKIQ